MPAAKVTSSLTASRIPSLVKPSLAAEAEHGVVGSSDSELVLVASRASRPVFRRRDAYSERGIVSVRAGPGTALLTTRDTWTAKALTGATGRSAWWGTVSAPEVLV